MKNAVIITPFDNYSYPVRIKYVERMLIEKGYNVLIISADFDHRNKTVYSEYRKNLELLHVPPYYKNLSIARIRSHKEFAKKVQRRLYELNPDLVYCSAPPNFLFKYVSKYKRDKQTTRLIYELGDLWPETLPLRKILKSLAGPILITWSRLRDRNIGFADYVIYECQMFKDVVSKAHLNVPCSVIYLSKEDYYKGNYIVEDNLTGPLRFAYVGSINNIIDIDLITEIMKRICSKREAELVVIGAGENSNTLFRKCDTAGVKYENHGAIYDEERKHQILSTCQFGLNIMKDSVVVGATMKSLEYFHEGLILINNIKGDTQSIVKDYHCGYNINNSSIDNIAKEIIEMTLKDMDMMRYNSRTAYEKLFSVSSLTEQLEKVFS